MRRTDLASRDRIRLWLARLAGLAILIASLAMLASAPAGARAGGGSSFGSRGSRSFSLPPPTPTAPGPVVPLPRAIGPGPGLPLGPPPPASSFGRGLITGLIGGGLIGLLLGHGVGSIFALILQAGLILILIRFAMNFLANLFGRRAALANGDAGLEPSEHGPRGSPGAASYSAPRASPAPPLAIAASDYAAFERLLAEIQAAYGREDAAALARMTTPQMFAHFQSELAANAARGLVNKVSGAKLLRGDLSEAWRESDADYATVAMRFQVLDMMVERASGRIASGDPANPQQATEVWTFTRPRGGDWQLAAIQQTD